MKKKLQNARLRKSGRGVLPIIAILLIGSAILRLGISADQAMATEKAAELLGLNDGVPCEAPEDMAALLEAFQNREKKLVLREEQIRTRMQALEIADRELETKLQRLSEAEERLRGTLALADSAAENDITRLISFYEAMKPKDAAILFEEMSPEFAAGFLARMKPEAAAGVLAGLTPQAAYSLSVILAGRNANVPRN